MKVTQIVYLESFNASNDTEIIVTLESSIVLFLLQFLDQSSDIEIHIVSPKVNPDTKLPISIRKNAFNIVHQTQVDYQTTIASKCNFPVFVGETNVIVAGLCGVCRAIIKSTDATNRYLLGFKESCLLAPSEASPWTKFCEIDMITCTQKIINFHNQLADTTNEYQLPNELACFESHMGQPVRVHNIHKVVQNLAKNGMENTVKSIEHKFVEDIQISIADILLFPNFWFIMNLCQNHTNNALELQLPLTLKWMQTVQEHPKLSKCLSIFSQRQQLNDHPKINYTINNIEKFSLYRHDPKRYKSKNRIFTRQEDIDRSLNKIEKLGIEFTSKSNNDNDCLSIDWNSLPFEALPEGGNLPAKRLQRKKDQLNGLAQEIIRIANDGDCIVDFCSGAGHLGILLACKLPLCKIYLLENKEESLMRAKQRVDQMKLTNCYFFQCNLDYFIGAFDIGTSLHACGVASDIVLMHCIQRRAKFICCPCCYGQCNEMPHISYPRSKFFRKNAIELNDYLFIAHCADQAHCPQTLNENVNKNVQGQLCMDIVDTDRKLYTEEFGYKTTLTRLHPEDCTPKNRLLIGII